MSDPIDLRRCPTCKREVISLNDVFYCYKPLCAMNAQHLALGGGHVHPEEEFADEGSYIAFLLQKAHGLNPPRPTLRASDVPVAGSPSGDGFLLDDRSIQVSNASGTLMPPPQGDPSYGDGQSSEPQPPPNPNPFRGDGLGPMEESAPLAPNVETEDSVHGDSVAQGDAGTKPEMEGL